MKIKNIIIPVVGGLIIEYFMIKGLSYALDEEPLRTIRRFPPLEQLILFTGSIYGTALLNSIYQNVKPPKAINFFRAVEYSSIGTYAKLTNNPELNERYYLRLQEIYNLGSSVSSEVLKLTRQRKFSQAMDLCLSHIDRNPITEQTKIYFLSSDAISYEIESFLAKRNKSIQDLLYLSINDLTYRNDQRLFARTLPSLLQLSDTLETRTIEAMFYSVRNQPKAAEKWKTIVEQCEQRSLGTSRNSVRELSQDEYFKDSIIIKEGKELQIEHDLLREIYQTTEEPHLYFPRPLAIYDKEDSQILITKRKKAKSLEETEIDQEEVNKTFNTLARLHSLPNTRKPYDPRECIERRLLKRFSQKDLEKFKQAYEYFIYNAERNRYYQPSETVTCHGDFYPTNVLQGGIIIDLEKACSSSPELDLTNFFTSSKLLNLNQQEARDSYEQIRRLKTTNQHFFEIQNALCQIGSFYNQRNLPNMIFNYERAKSFLQEQREFIFKEELERLIEPVITNLM